MNETIYKLLKDYEHPCGIIRSGVCKTGKEWQEIFPKLNKGDCDIKKDWFQAVGGWVDNPILGDRYPLCQEQVAQIDCREAMCRYNKLSRCCNISPAITLFGVKATCWSKKTY